MRHKYWTWPQGTVSEEICDKWIAENDYDLQGGLINSDRQTDTVRRSKIKFIETPEVRSLIHSFATTANREAFGFDITSYMECQFTKYEGSSSDFYDWHRDTRLYENNSMFDRKLSCVVLLNDPSEFEGGQFRIEGDPVEGDTVGGRVVPLGKGSVLVFPSMLNHCVTPVTKGIRYSMVSWVEGPAWR